MSDPKPRVVCFSCNFGWGYLSDREALAAAIEHWAPVVCSGKITSAHIMEAFKRGADGVLVLGCPEGDCHFQDGNYQTKKKVLLLKKLLAEYGIEPERLKMVFSRDPSGGNMTELVGQLAKEIRGLGPLRIRGSLAV